MIGRWGSSRVRGDRRRGNTGYLAAYLWELKEDFGVGGHCEGFDAGLFPGGKGGGECYGVGLKYSEAL